jgi:hypothetical protein
MRGPLSTKRWGRASRLRGYFLEAVPVPALPNTRTDGLVAGVLACVTEAFHEAGVPFVSPPTDTLPGGIKQMFEHYGMFFAATTEGNVWCWRPGYEEWRHVR